MSKALVTGASGFIGRHVVPHLIEKGYDIRCLVRPASDRSFLGQFPAEFVEGDVTDFESLCKAVDSVEFVFHLAGVAQVVSNCRFFKLHTQGTVNVAQACLRRSNPPRLIHVSSLAAMGPARDKKPTLETAFARPVSPYGRSKHLAEKELGNRADQLPCSIVRPPYVIGEGDHASIPLFRMIYKQHIHLIPGFFNNLYSFVHAEDLAHLLALVAEKGELLTKNSLPGSPRDDSPQRGLGIYNASCGELIKFGDFGRMIAQAYGIEKIRIIHVPPLACVGVGLFYEAVKKLTGKTVPFDWNKIREALRGPWICDDTKTRTQLGFVPQPFDKRIEQTVRWYRF
ncbi:MAG: NAD-dependent epimerase/dehydratase family protein [Planctomycetaceae bacterium]|nr:NAD-dependent epimerase/dehydratase family protein [Planctomycetaceae bacterium]